MARQKDIKFYQEWRLTSPMAILFIAIRRFRRVVRSVIEILSLGGLTVVLLQFLDVGLVTAILSYAAALLVFIVISAVLSYFVLRVHISNDGISMKSGVFRRTHKVVPWDKVRSVNLESGPIERLFNLSRVSVDTASSMGAEIEIPAMPIYVGTYLRRYVQEPNRSDYKEPAEDQVNQDLPGGTESNPLYTIQGENMFIAAM
ncbi:MAG: PH domain-containing protein [Gammaproteobacteria bacterium]|nr:PH domain-containing protein [Gammaproteobacteria bacterium]